MVFLHLSHLSNLPVTWSLSCFCCYVVSMKSLCAKLVFSFFLLDGVRALAVMTERTSTRAFGSEICTAQLLTEEKSSLIPRLRLEWCCLRASIFTCHKQLSNSDRAKDFTLDIFHTCGSQELYTFAFSKSVVREVDNSSHEAESKAFINLCSCYLVCEVNFQETRGIFRIPHDPGSPL